MNSHLVGATESPSISFFKNSYWRPSKAWDVATGWQECPRDMPLVLNTQPISLWLALKMVKWYMKYAESKIHYRRLKKNTEKSLGNMVVYWKENNTMKYMYKTEWGTWLLIWATGTWRTRLRSVLNLPHVSSIRIVVRDDGSSYNWYIIYRIYYHNNYSKHSIIKIHNVMFFFIKRSIQNESVNLPSTSVNSLNLVPVHRVTVVCYMFKKYTWLCPISNIVQALA